ncbi:MAG: hypothetical protein CHACPFDD_03393 [Phycisphaerae bacterium]|nr:hypothetical protein [Phycisphaerae bacterium]
MLTPDGESTPRREAIELPPASLAEALIRCSLDMIISVDLQRRIFEFNPAAERQFGYARHEVLGRPVDMLYAEPAEGAALSAQTLRCGFCGELWNRRKDGTRFCCYVSASPLHDASGAVVGLMGISRDITEQRRSREALQQAHADLEKLNGELDELNRALEGKVRQRTAELRAAYDDTLDALVLALDAREHATAGHSRRVAVYCVELALRCGLSDGALENIYRGALLHDIGKIGVPDAVLLKPGRLDDAERRVIEQHVVIGARLLERVGYLQSATTIPRFHHERYDGGGYVAGLAGEAIPPEARAFAIIDVYDALRSQRPYKPALGHDDARKVIRGGAGREFDPRMCAAFADVSEQRWAALAGVAGRTDRFDEVLAACRAS